METIPEVIKNSVNKNGKNVALYFKKDNQLNSMTYNELDRKATQLSIALIENLGVEKGEHIALISNNRPEWIMCNLGIIYTGAADVPRGSDTPDSQILLPQKCLSMQQSSLPCCCQSFL